MINFQFIPINVYSSLAGTGNIEMGQTVPTLNWMT